MDSQYRIRDVKFYQDIAKLLGENNTISEAEMEEDFKDGIAVAKGLVESKVESMVPQFVVRIRKLDSKEDKIELLMFAGLDDDRQEQIFEAGRRLAKDNKGYYIASVTALLETWIYSGLDKEKMKQTKEITEELKKTLVKSEAVVVCTLGVDMSNMMSSAEIVRGKDNEITVPLLGDKVYKGGESKMAILEALYQGYYYQVSNK